MMTEISGEYWICYGQAMYADGDLGDINHEGLVIQHVFQELVDELLQSERFSEIGAEWFELCEYSDGIDTIMAREIMNNHVDYLLKRKIITEKESDDIEEAIRKEIGWPTDKLEVALGNIDDARVYGINNLKWIRVLNNNIQLAGLTKSRLKELADGLYECFGENWEATEYNIEDSKNGKVYWGVPASIIDDGNMGSLRQFEPH